MLHREYFHYILNTRITSLNYCEENNNNSPYVYQIIKKNHNNQILIAIIVNFWHY
jgi:hypothetical protein